MKHRILAVWALFAVCLAAHQAQAESNQTAADTGAPKNRPVQEPQSLESMVIVGRTTNVDITSEDLEMQQASDLADIFRLVPSVSVGGSIGIAQKVYIRGIEDTLLNITVDGAPQTGTLFHHIGRVNIEPELLKQVEVQAGAGEATSGFGAIGGAIRFRTKSAEDLLDPGERFGGLAKAGYFSNDGYKLSLSLFGRLTDDWSVLASYVWVDRGNMKDGKGNTLFGTAAEQSLAFVKINGNLSDDQQLSLSFERRDEKGEFGQRPNWPVFEGEPLFPGKATRNTATLNYRLNPSEYLDLEATFYFTESNFKQHRYDRWGLYGAEIQSFGLDVRNTSQVGPHRIVYGIEYRNDRVTSQYLDDVSVWGPWAWDASLGEFTEKGDVVGVYIQDHWQIFDPLTLSFGVRYDAYDLKQVTYNDGTDSDGVSPNVGLSYEITPGLTFLAGYAEAMRGKEVGDAFTLEKRPGRISIDPNLKPEKVVNREVGLVYDDGVLRGSISYFNMKIDDVILDQLGGGTFPEDSSYYENVGKLKTDGVEVRVGATLWDVLHADIFFTTYDSELNGNTVEGYEHIGLANASGDRWNFNLVYAPSPEFEIGWSTTHVEGLHDIVVLHRALEIGWIDALQTVNKPSYTVHDIYIQWAPWGPDHVRFNLAIQNLFDKQYRDHASVADYNHIPDWEGVAGLFEPGRDVRLSVAVSF